MIILITKDDCEWCDKAKLVLAEKGALYKELRIGIDIDLVTFKNLMPEVKTIPLALEVMKIGDYTALVEYLTKES